ncbi:MAG: hypothetical protein M1830_001523 [Pleopsidium flavum]|nr:MAG: hypothetical protein M1830_001523 [Pleopsidium flavum]
MSEPPPSPELRSSQLPCSQQSYQPSQTLSFLDPTSPISRRTRNPGLNLLRNTSAEDLLEQQQGEPSHPTAASFSNNPTVMPRSAAWSPVPPKLFNSMRSRPSSQPAAVPKASQRSLASPCSFSNSDRKKSGTLPSTGASATAIGGNVIEVMAHLQGTSSHIPFTLGTSMTMESLRHDLWTTFHDYTDPNADPANWPAERNIHRIVVHWDTWAANEQGQIVIFDRNLSATLRLLSQKQRLGLTLTVILGE